MSETFFNFYNPKNNSDRIFTKEDLNEMDIKEYSVLKNAIFYQVSKIGIPSEHELNNSASVTLVNIYNINHPTQNQRYFRARRINKKVVVAENL